VAWFRLSDDFSTHPKIIGLSDAAHRSLIASYCYAARHLTDGAIVNAAARVLAAPKVQRELVTAGLWDEVAGGFLIHDYLDYNPTGDEVREKKAAHADSMRRMRASKKAKRDYLRDVSRDDHVTDHKVIT